eukprot:Em0012g475a
MLRQLPYSRRDEKALHCDVVKLLMKTTDGDDLELEFLVVPLICEALSGQVITRALDNYPHLVGLDLAEIGTGTTKKVDVLIGSDHYWKVVSGEIVRGSTGPTALKSRFGWILSGPLSGLMECSTISNLACCQTLLTNSDPLQKSDTELEIALRRFWDLESLGIQGEEPTLLYKIAIIGDIEKAFLMTSVAPEDRDALRFLWVDDTSVGFPQIVEFRFARVVFGVSSSPFLLNGTLKYVETFKAVDPKFVDKFSRSIYVDDFVSGADEEGEFYDLYQKCKITGSLIANWKKLVAGLQGTEPFRVPRCYFLGVDKSAALCTLEGFCDASSLAYRAVVYLRIEIPTDTVVRFVTAKTRVAQMHNSTIPRLELLAALLPARLVTAVLRALQPELPLQGTRCYSDSTILLDDSTSSQARVKYGSVCILAVQAEQCINLEVVPDLTAEAFIRCFRRFVARRGIPRKIISDNGKTFKAAIKTISKIVKDPVVQGFLIDRRVQWTFNLERAPWWGGLFERRVGLMKRCLKKSIGQAKVTLDELTTIVAEVDITLNSRPLTYLYAEELEEPLTPSHLLVGRRLYNLPDPSCGVDKDPTYGEKASHATLTRRMKYLGTMLQHFWLRWRREYLTELREHHRYGRLGASTNHHDIVRVGDIVTVYNKNMPTAFWKLAKVHHESEVEVEDQPVKDGIRPRRAAFQKARQRIQSWMKELEDEINVD